MPTVTIAEAQQLLTRLQPGAKIEIERTPRGDIKLTNGPTKEDILKAKYKHLMGKNITLSEAAKKYDVPRGTLDSWYRQSHYIKPVGHSYPAVFDEAEIAYCVDIYRQRRLQKSKAPLLDENGLPYEIKHPNLASYRKRKKEQKN